MLSLTIDQPSDADQRIDKFLKKYLREAPLGGIYKWLRTGKVKVNRKKVEQTYRLELGDILEIWLTDEEISGFQEQSSNLPTFQDSNSQTLKLSILFEDEYLMIVNKPSGINVHPWDHKTKEVSLIELIQDYLEGRYDSLSFKPALVHRIDRDTSGCIMIAKDKQTLEKLLDLLQHEGIQKIYHTIVVGTPLKPRDTIRARLLRVEDAQDEAKVRVDPDGQEAITHYSTVKANIRDKYSFLECRIETGRMHQIRVHMASIGIPVLWDKTYGDKWENSFAKRSLGIHRQLLHAQSLALIHPRTGSQIYIEAPYQEDMLNMLNG